MTDTKGFYVPEHPDDSMRPDFDRNIDSITFGPYQRNIYIKIEAYADGNGGHDDSWAWLELYLGGSVTRVEDKSFNQYHLRIVKEFVLSAGSALVATVKTSNGNGPTEIDHGIRVLDWFWLQ